MLYAHFHRALEESKNVRIKKMIHKKMKKIISVALSVLMFANVVLPVYALDIPTPPPAPTAPALPNNPDLVPTPPPVPTAPPGATLAPATPTPVPTPKPIKTPSPTATPLENSSGTPSPVPTSNVASTPTPSVAPVVDNGTGGQRSDGGQGSEITTGDATTTGIANTDVNTNNAITPTGSESGIGVVNSGNGVESTNDAGVSVVDNSTTIQNNDATVGNNVLLGTTTGENSSSRNTGGDNTITTGDANVSGTIVNTVNTNLAGVSVSEFNIEDTHRGDYVLDFAANCISNCGGAGGSVQNTGNGANSTNDAAASVTTNTATFQNNDAVVGNNLTLAADSGSNDANRNTGGDNTINTGDANVSASVLNMVNNNVAGNIYYGVVNVFGDLIGDIVLPASTVQTLASNSGNGADSTNNAAISNQSDTTTTQVNNATIDNNLVFDATTGDNQVSKNTDGTNNVKTGDSSVTAQVVNVVNSNVAGGDWWLVIVNEAGKWIGRIVGSPEGSNMGGSQGTEFAVGANGEITAVNSGNGAESNNSASVNQSTNTTTTQTNNAHVTNNINLSANTGKNDASRNTGGDSSVTTGDANIVASLVNFVNNNVAAGGRLFVTVVNVFGNWTGNFRGIGQEAVQASANETGIGGVSEIPNVQSSNDSSGTSSNESTTIVTTEPTAKPKSVASYSTSHLSLANQGVSPEDESETEEIVPQVLGMQAAADSSRTINLAWILPIVLVLAIGSFGTKFILSRVRA